MKAIAALAMLAALFGADVAIAAGAVHHRTQAHHAAVRLHKASQTSRRRARQHPTMTTSPSAAAEAPAGVHHTADADADASGRAGWFRSERDRQAGWGMRQGATQTVVGFYQRPSQPGIPGPQTYHTPEGRGAAGLSLSFKLGQ